MSDLINSLTEFLGPAGSSALGRALVGLVILVIGLFLVKLFVGIVKKLLSRFASLKRVQADGSEIDFTAPVLSLTRAVLTILVLMAVLDYFGLTNVLDPLKVMVRKFTAVLPNMIGAGVITYAGWVIAKIVSQLAGVALDKVDEQLYQRTGHQDIKLSKLGSALVFAAILLPVIVSALGVLNIAAISDPASAMILKLMAAVPNILGAFVVLAVVYFAAKFVVHVLTGILEGMKINALPAKLGVTGLFSESFTPMKLIGGAIMFFSMLAAAAAAVNILGIEVISLVFARVLEFGGGLLVGGVILIVGNFLGTLAYEKLTSHGNDVLANIARIAILGLVLAMGLRAMGLADSIVTMAFGFTLGSVAVAAALAFGLGGRDAAKKIADRWVGGIKDD
jgi:hypothetical protein